MAKIAVIGDAASALGFKAFGLDAFPVNTVEEARHVLHRIAGEDYGIIYITEELAEELSHEIGRYSAKPLPSIIRIPGVKGNTGAGIRGVKKTVEQAVGSDILFGDE